MPRTNMRVAVPTEGAGKRRRSFGLRDVLVTAAIAALVVGLSYAFGQRGEGEGSFVEISPFSGVASSGPPPALGKPAPDFEVPLLSGGTFRLSEHRGQVVWINLWATWCPPCRVEMPDIEAVWRDETRGDLVVIAVDYAENQSTVTEFVDRLDLTFPIGMDPTGRVALQYRLAGFPSHFMVDRDGVVRVIRVGLMSEATMRQELARVGSH